MSKYNEFERVIVLGSGFSKAFSNKIPTIKDLSSKLFTDDWFKNKIDFKELGKFSKIFKSINYNTEDFKTIEKVATAIFSDRMSYDFKEKEKSERLKYQLMKFIYLNLKDFKIDEFSKKTMLDFLKYIILEHSDEGSYYGKNLLITFNYDLLLEDFLKNTQAMLGPYHLADIYFDYGINLQNYNKLSIQEESNKSKALLFLKLHGSFNWFKVKGIDEENIHSIFQVDPDDKNYEIHHNDIPIFIPMAHTKELFLHGTLYNTLWAKAKNYINKASEIYFIGYGFPETDINNLLYFHSLKNKIKKIIVKYDEPGDNNLSRLISIFGKNKIVNINAVEYLRENSHKFCRWKI